MPATAWTVLTALCLVFAPPLAVLAADQAAPAKSDEAAKAPAGTALDEIMKDPNRKVGFIRKTLKLADGTERIYQVWVPLPYTADKKWPVILFLHGAGERGTDGEKVLIQGLPKEIKKRGGQFDFLVVMPQCASFEIDKSAPPPPPGERPKRKGGWQGAEEETAMAALHATLKEYACDADRVYLTGLSLGGFGSFAFALKYPKEFAAVVPICGGGPPERMAEIRDLPIWIWHGDADKTVPVDNSRRIAAALVAAKAAELRYTEVPGVGHNSWDTTYADDNVWKWLAEHKLSDRGKAKPVSPVISAPGWADAPKP